MDTVNHEGERRDWVEDRASEEGTIEVRSLNDTNMENIHRQLRTRRVNSYGKLTSLSAKNNTRGRPKKDHEPEPFLSIENVAPKTQSIEPTVFQMGNKAYSPKVPVNTPMPRSTSASSGGWNSLVPRKTKGLPLSAKLGTTVGPQIKTPFKHCVKKPKNEKMAVNPDLAMKEMTAIATYQVARAMAKQVVQQEEKRHGKLLKAKLKPLVCVNTDGPSIENCRGIVSDTHSYSASPSRTLQRRRNILASLSKDFLYERPQTGESIHRTSIASDLTEGREDDLKDELTESSQEKSILGRSAMAQSGGRRSTNKITESQSAHDTMSGKAVRFQAVTDQYEADVLKVKGQDAEERNSIDEDFPVASDEEEEDVDDDDVYDDVNEANDLNANSNNNNNKKKKKKTKPADGPPSVPVSNVSDGFWDARAGDRRYPQPTTRPRSRLGEWSDAQKPDVNVTRLSVQGSNQGRSNEGRNVIMSNSKVSIEFEKPYLRNLAVYRVYGQLERPLGYTPAEFREEEKKKLKKMRPGSARPPTRPNSDLIAIGNKSQSRPFSAHAGSAGGPSRPVLSTQPATINVRQSVDVGNVDRVIGIHRPWSAVRRPTRSDVKVRVRPQSAVVRREEAPASHCLTCTADAYEPIESDDDEGSIDIIIPHNQHNEVLEDDSHPQEVEPVEPEEVQQPSSNSSSVSELASRLVTEVMDDVIGHTDGRRSSASSSSHSTVSHVANNIVSFVLGKLKDEGQSEGQTQTEALDEDEVEIHNCTDVTPCEPVTNESESSETEPPPNAHKSLDDVHAEIRSCLQQNENTPEPPTEAKTPPKRGRSYVMTVYQFREESADIAHYDVTLMRENSVLRTAKSDREQQLLQMITAELTYGLRQSTKKNTALSKKSKDKIPDEVFSTVKALIQQNRSDASDSEANKISFHVNARPPAGLIYYFAYGEDMNPERLSTLIKQNICERFWGLLYGFKLIYEESDAGGTTRPQLVFDANSCVEGCVYLLLPEQIEELDSNLGHSQGLEHVLLPVWLLNSGGELSVAQYCVPTLTYVTAQNGTHSTLLL